MGADLCEIELAVLQVDLVFWKHLFSKKKINKCLLNRLERHELRNQ